MSKLLIVIGLLIGTAVSALGQGSAGLPEAPGATTLYYGLTTTRSGTTDPTGISCSNYSEFAVTGTKWLSCVNGLWTVIGGGTGGGGGTNNETWTVSFCSSGVCNNDAPLNRKPVIFGSTHAVKCVFDARVAPTTSVKVDMKRTDGTSLLNLTGGVELNGATFPLVFTAGTAVSLVVGTDTITFTLIGTTGQGITASCYSN